MRTTKPVVFGFDVDLRASMAVLDGLTEFSKRERLGWNIVPLELGSEAELPILLRERAVSGIVAPFISDHWLHAEADSRAPVINIEWLSVLKSVSSIGVDYRHAGLRAGEFFRACGLAAVACLGATGRLAVRELNAGLAAAATTPVLTAAPGADHLLRDWLRTLPRPCGLLVADPALAMRVLRLAREAGDCRIPDDVSVLALGDATLHAMRAGHGISCIPLPYREIGLAAGEQLARHLAGDPTPRRIVLPPTDIVESDTTRIPRSRVVERAEQFMRRHLAGRVRIDEVARHCAVSRRLLEMEFQARRGQPPYQVLFQMRMAHARTLLGDTNLRVLAIAEASGFTTQHAFSAAFHKEHGLSPRAWRTRAGSP